MRLSHFWALPVVLLLSMTSFADGATPSPALERLLTASDELELERATRQLGDKAWRHALTEAGPRLRRQLLLAAPYLDDPLSSLPVLAEHSRIRDIRLGRIAQLVAWQVAQKVAANPPSEITVEGLPSALRVLQSCRPSPSCSRAQSAATFLEALAEN